MLLFALIVYSFCQHLMTEWIGVHAVSLNVVKIALVVFAGKHCANVGEISQCSTDEVTSAAATAGHGLPCKSSSY